jgi:hypothetical protein
MVHGGNSGGPVTLDADLSVVGIVTKRRFFGDPEMQEVDKEMGQLLGYLDGIKGRGSVSLMGVNFAEFAGVMARVVTLTNELLRRNSTTGIGLANSIFPVTEKCRELKLL